ncbi:MAG: M17 family peptidase N-terminal domain-containing protein, partial [Xanthobacteraceae bacterium]
MSGALKLEFAPLATPARGVLVLFCEEGLKFGSAAARTLTPPGGLVTRAAAADLFKGKHGSALDLVAPRGLHVPRLVVVGMGKARELKARDFVKLGGT